MSTNRREFIEKLGATAMLGALPIHALPSIVHEAQASGRTSAQAAEWDFSWVAKLKGKKHKAVMDNEEVQSAYGVWRATFWANQYEQALGAKPSDIGTVLVLRHNALVLGFQQDFWDTAGIGDWYKVTHPLTQQGTTRNPALLSSSRNEIPATFDAFALTDFMRRGGIVLACSLAMDFFISGLAGKMSITPDEARKRAMAALIPGVTLMPSGIFACVKAQEEGCQYVKAA
jgi:hypothetical protein